MASTPARPLLPRWIECLIALAMTTFLLVVLWPVKGIPPRRRERIYLQVCAEHIGRVAAATLAYARSNDARLPPGDGWGEAIMPYLGNEHYLDCYARGEAGERDYAINPDLAGRRLDDFAQDDQPETVLIYEVQNGRLVEPHRSGANYAFLDGHVKWLADPPEGFEPMQVIQP
jgi:prepilin-type processing-associated H-X9-DG protein